MKEARNARKRPKIRIGLIAFIKLKRIFEKSKLMFFMLCFTKVCELTVKIIEIIIYLYGPSILAFEFL